MDRRIFLRITILSLLLSTCSESKQAGPSSSLTPAIPFPSHTPVIPSPTYTSVKPSPSPDLRIFEPVLGQYTDQQAEAFNERLQQLVDSLGDDPIPKDILQRAGIKVEALRASIRAVGGCTFQTAYELSPSYDLVVDDNACFGYFVRIIKK